MYPINAYDQPLDVEVFNGEVVVRGSHGPTAVALTPEAAQLTASRLVNAAREAKSQLASQASGSDD